MASGRDDDFDWLYGRDDPRASEPEPTRVFPAVPAQAGQTRPVALPQHRPPAAVVRPQPAPPLQPAPYGSGGAGGPGIPPGPGGPGRPKGPKKPVRRFFTGVAIILAALLVWLIAIPVYAWSRIDRVDAAPGGDRPANQPGTTVLLVGSDSREGLSKAEQKKLGTGSTGGQRTDTIMILSIPPGGQPALISVPRDSYVPIPGHGSNKINAAYAFGGPELLVQTVEQNTGLRIDAYTEIGFGGFVNVIDALGGIEMCLPKAIKDRDSHLDLPKGCQNLDGKNALGYVRMRKADPLGDLGRVKRQREMLAAIAKDAASPATVVNPVRYFRLLTSGFDALTIGEDTSFLEVVKMANAMRKVSVGQGLTLTVPVANSGAFTPAGSAVTWDEQEAKSMFDDIARGDTSELKKYEK